ncbi:hypothetical protein F5B20DRAFT_553296 [Whalleya microplaca]|nr:hypothetical protein F5B20DRAFT_553296 [Whalleya microplaca]
MLFTPLLKFLALLHALDRLRRHLRVGKTWFLLVLASIPFLASFLANFCLGHSCKALVSEETAANAAKVIEETTANVWFEGLSIVAPMTRAYKWFTTGIDGAGYFWGTFMPAYILLFVYEWCNYLYCDYYITFKDLGRGGSPPTFNGWATARIRAWFANVDVMTPPRVSPMADPYRGRLNTLPHREGERPTILGVTPQRQVNFRAPPNTQAQLERLMGDIVRDLEAANGQDGQQPQDHIEVRASFLEGGLMALRRRLQVPTTENGGPEDARASWNTGDEFGGEVFHPHRDGTSHVVLHPEDVKVVIDSGYGERHPFATEVWYWKFWFHSWLGIRRPVPTGLVILYAPRHAGEHAIIRQIVEAAIWNETGGRLYSLTADTFAIPDAPAAAPVQG